jgi:hypothetical protein
VNVDIENQQAPASDDIIADPVYDGMGGDVVHPDPEEANALARMWASAGDRE